MGRSNKKLHFTSIQKRTAFEDLWNNLVSHPIISAALLCFASAAIFLGNTKEKLTSQSLLIVFAIFIAGLAAFVISSKKLRSMKKTVQTIILLCLVLASFILFSAISIAEKNIVLLFAAGALIAVFAVFWLKINNKLTTGNVIAIIFLLGFTLRLIYILYTPISSRQHDVGTFGYADGHIGYIEHLYRNGSLTEGDVRNYDQYYHPPLHHTLEAIWLFILTKIFSVDIYKALECLQFLTMFYSCLIMIITYKILKFFKLDAGAMIAAFCVVAFHPTFLLLSGSINNDVLSIAFALGAVLSTLYWYREQTFGNIIRVALCVGLGMMTKLSVWMIAPGIAALFLTVLIKNKDRIAKLIAQMCTFGVIAFPLGLWWSVRNLLLFNVPFSYIPAGGVPGEGQYVGHYSVFDRLFNFNLSQFESVYDQFTWYGGKYFEYNPTIGLLKTAMFDEDTYFGLDFLSQALFWSGTVLAVAAFAAMIYVLFKKSNIIDRTIKVFLTMVYATIFIFYYLFCFEYPYTCTENIRYAVPLIIIGIVYLGIILKMFSHKNAGKLQKTAKYCICTLIFIFAISSISFYFMAGTARHVLN